MKQKTLKRIMVLIMSVVMVVGTVYLPGEAMTVKAQNATKTITGLGVGDISNPVTTEGISERWGKETWDYKVKISKWDTVEFGSYPQESNGKGGFFVEPIEWRVLSVSDGDLFLLADKGLDAKNYNENESGVTWETCTLRKWLNALDDYEGDDQAFLNVAFTEEEKAAIALSEVVNLDCWDGTPGGNDTRDYLYLLSYDEAKNADYGFVTDYRYKSREYSRECNRVAIGTGYAKERGIAINNSDYTEKDSCYWWLRTSASRSIKDNTFACLVSQYGEVGSGSVCTKYANKQGAVRPVLHINPESIIAVTKVEGVGENVKSKYRLTLHDDKMQISTGAGNKAIRSGNEITVTYSITGDNSANATQVSVLLLNYESGNSIPNTSETNDLPEFTYIPLEAVGGEFTTSGSGKFVLPEAYRGKTCGVDYFAYIMAEDVSGGVQPSADFASTPVRKQM